MKYKIVLTTNCKKDIQNIKKQGKDLEKFYSVVDLLANDIDLPKKYCNHKLKGKLLGYWDCHIEPDWILIYKKIDQELVIQLSRTGSHAKIL